VESFRVVRALVLAFRAWFASFIPITLVAAIVYAPVVIWMITLPDLRDARAVERYEVFLTHGVYLVAALTALVPPLVTYRVVQYMNGAKVPMLTSVRFGLRGVLPAVIIAVVHTLVGFVPMGFVVQFVLTCYWFVATPAAVAEKLGPGDALSRSAQLTAGRRAGIFALVLVTGLGMVVALYAVFVPAMEALGSGGAHTLATFKQTLIICFAVFAAFQLLLGIVQAVSYSLLRTDKEGVSNEELAAVFE
jgi:hypothetical protein